MTVAAKRKNIQIQVGRTFHRRWRMRKDDTPTYYNLTAATVRVYDKYGASAIDQVTATATGDADGYVDVQITPAETATVIDPGDQPNQPTLSTWGWWELDVTTDGGEVIGLFYGQVALLRKLGAG